MRAFSATLETVRLVEICTGLIRSLYQLLFKKCFASVYREKGGCRSAYRGLSVLSVVYIKCNRI